MKNRKQFVMCACGVCLLLLVTSPTWAQGKKGGGGGGGGRQPMPQPAPAPAVSPEQQAYDKAVKALADVTAKARVEFEKGTDWTSAQADVKQAVSDLETARKAAADDLAGNADYQQALSDKKQAQADLDAAKASDANGPDVITPIATKLMLASAKVSQVEKASADKNPGVLAAKDKLKTANAALDALKQKFQDSLKDNADWVTAQKAVDTAAQALPNPPKAAGSGANPGGGA